MRITMKGARLRLSVFRVARNPRCGYDLVGTLLTVPDGGIGHNPLGDRTIYTDIETESRRQPDNPILINIPVYYTEDMLAITADGTKGHIFCGNMVCRRNRLTYLGSTEDAQELSQDELEFEIAQRMYREIEDYAHFLRGDVFDMTVRYRDRIVSQDSGGWRLLYLRENSYGMDPETNGMFNDMRYCPHMHAICMGLAKSVMHDFTHKRTAAGYPLSESMRESQHEESVCE